MYDLKCHPDFKFLIGSQVIRIANFDEDVKCIVGHVIECGVEGRIKVFWVNGRCSKCYPLEIILVSPYLDYSDSEYSNESENESSNSFPVTDDESVVSLTRELSPLIDHHADLLTNNLKGVRYAIHGFGETIQGDFTDNQEV